MSVRSNSYNRERILWIDAAKAIGILMVVFGHNWLDEKFCYYFYSFHMPLFFILAGITFSTKKDFADFSWKKFKTLIIPYLFFSVCIMVVYWIMSYTHSGDYNIRSEVFSYLKQQRHTHLWFLPVLFASELVVFIILNQLNQSRSIVLLGIAAVLIAVHSLMANLGCNNWLWNLDLVPMASVFIIIGFVYKQKNSEASPYENNLMFVGLLMILSIAISTINYIYNGQVDIKNNDYGSYPLFIVGALVSTYFLISVLKRFSLPQWMIYIGMYSLVYYGLHRIVIDIMFAVYAKCGIVYDGESIVGVGLACINVIAVLLLLYPVVEFLNKKSPWLLGKF